MYVDMISYVDAVPLITQRMILYHSGKSRYLFGASFSRGCRIGRMVHLSVFFGTLCNKRPRIAVRAAAVRIHQRLSEAAAVSFARTSNYVLAASGLGCCCAHLPVTRIPYLELRVVSKSHHCSNELHRVAHMLISHGHHT